MLTAVRSARPVQLFASNNRSVRFVQAMSGPNQPHSTEKLARSLESNHQSGETIASFGEGYATRSDEEGFGGVYGENQALHDKDEDKIVHGNAPEYDKTQGSEVKEKERARNQKVAQ